MKNFFIALFLLLCLCSCDDKGVYQYSHWKYYDGHSIGDVLSFGRGEANTFRNDTIFLNGQPQATLIRIERRLFTSNILIIKTLKTEKKGRYIGK